MKYKVGDKVKIKENLIVGKTYGGLYLHDGAGRHIGEETIVTKVERERYRVAVDNSSRIWTNEMLEPVEEMSAEEAVSLYAKMCKDNNCYACPVYKKSGECGCEEFAINHPKEVIESLKQWKADHEKKPIETEFIWYLLVVEEKTHIVKHEKPLKIERERTTDEQKEELLREWCSEHDGKYYVTTERRCVVKE
jgi:hypothetical protein